MRHLLFWILYSSTWSISASSTPPELFSPCQGNLLDPKATILTKTASEVTDLTLQWPYVDGRSDALGLLWADLKSSWICEYERSENLLTFLWWLFCHCTDICTFKGDDCYVTIGSKGDRVNALWTVWMDLASQWSIWHIIDSLTTHRLCENKGSDTTWTAWKCWIIRHLLNPWRWQSDTSSDRSDTA